MVAMTKMMPSDPDERATVRRVLREHPELERFIERISRHATELFPGAEMTLDTRQFDDWDPPIQVVVTAPLQTVNYGDTYLRLLEWMNADPDYDPGQVHVSLRMKRQGTSIR